ncbi:unnamed protein product [Zymoseptoria tritici ST99CH_1E4]|uniref:Pet127-domain-containing protein n=1 Tax=Zymoseptoria tritici ST99CH_1E4 TaxID=1276532 RepID=A0A2H1GST2_ZYMTR|nr:unnamed protein product [Zymoseptoria tritici ST99CH_1E4]
MLAKGFKPPTWTNQGYVCLSCRSQRATRFSRRQSRHSSSEVASRRAADEDVFALNDINHGFGDKPAKAESTWRRLSPLETQSNAPAPAATSSEGPPWTSESFRPLGVQAADVVEEGTSSREPTNSKERRLIQRRKERRLSSNVPWTTQKVIRNPNVDAARITKSTSEHVPASSKVDVKSLLDRLGPQMKEELKRKEDAMDEEVQQREREAAQAKDNSQQRTAEHPDTSGKEREHFAKPASQPTGWRAGLKYIKDKMWSDSKDNKSRTSKQSVAAQDSAESLISSAVGIQPLSVKPTKSYTSLMKDTSGDENYKIVNLVDAHARRPKFGGNAAPSSTDDNVLYFESFGKKNKTLKFGPSAIASQPYGLPEPIARTRSYDSSNGTANAQHPSIQSLVDQLSGKAQPVSGELPPSAPEEPKVPDGSAFKRLSGLYDTRADADTSTKDAAKGQSNTSAVYKDYLASRSEKHGVSIEHAMENALSVPGKSKVRKPGRAKKSDSLKSKSVESTAPAGVEVDKDSAPSAPPPAEEAPPADDPPESTEPSVDIKTSSPGSLEIKPLNFPQPPVPFLEYGLDRVLFNPGVYQLQDSVSRVYNFDPYLQNIMPAVEFDFDSLKEYKTSSEDQTLVQMAKKTQSKYIGSTSSMTSSLAHFHHLLSNWRPLNLDMMSKGFVGPTTSNQLTNVNKAPSAIFLRWKNGTYAIDADKEYDNANVLMLLGKSMELLLTQPKSEFERYRKSDPRKIPDAERLAPETYQYSTMRDFLMRSQLDAYDPRLPGNGTFDLKTRAVVTVRMQSHDHEEMTGYELLSNQGRWFSYEKEWFDMMRSTMVKYILQARMGQMNGIFVAYHNVERIFGFQYVPMADMDRALHGQTDPTLGDQEFRASLDLMNEVLNKATAKYPEQSLRIHFETVDAKQDMPTSLHIFAEPMTEDEIDTIQSKQKAKIAEFERNVMGKEETDLDKVVDEAAEDAQTASAAQPEDDVVGEEASDGFSTDVEQNDEALAKAAAEDEGSSDQDTPVDEEIPATSSEEDANAYARELINTSNASADAKFLDNVDKTMTAESSEELRPLFYATVIVQSTVNGQTPSDGRPSSLRPDDKWDIDYILKEYNITRHQWALYEDMKARRRFAYNSREDADDPDAPPLSREEERRKNRGDGFMRLLRGMSDKGRQLREKVDEKDEGKTVVLVDEPLNRTRVEINSVDDYMDWMCGKK